MSNWNNRTQAACFTNRLCLQNDLIKLKSQTLKMNISSRQQLGIIASGKTSVQLFWAGACTWVAGWHLLTCGGCTEQGSLAGLGATTPGLYMASKLPLPAATAPQQEADPEVNTETLTKSSQGAPPALRQPPRKAAPKEKETPAEKSKDGSVSICPTRLGAKQNLRPAPSHRHGESVFRLQVGAQGLCRPPPQVC